MINICPGCGKQVFTDEKDIEALTKAEQKTGTERTWWHEKCVDERGKLCVEI